MRYEIMIEVLKTNKKEKIMLINLTFNKIATL